MVFNGNRMLFRIGYIGLVLWVSNVLSRAALYETVSISVAAFGGGQHSASYSQITEGGGGPLSSAKVTGVSYLLRPGFVGRAVDPVSASLRFSNHINDNWLRENTARVLSLVVSEDDETTTWPGSGRIDWEIISGPISISPDGTVTASSVRLDELAWVQASHLGVSAQLLIQVYNFVADYADWQANHFSPAELLSGVRLGPSESFSGDGHSNLVKYALNADPRATLASLPLQNSFNGSVLSLAFARHDRSDVVYRVESSADLLVWQTLWSSAGQSPRSEWTTITDQIPLSVSHPRRFLRLNITRLPAAAP